MCTKKKRKNNIEYIVIVKKEDKENCKSYKSYKVFKHKTPFYILYKLFWRIKGYEVEEC